MPETTPGGGVIGLTQEQAGQIKPAIRGLIAHLVAGAEGTDPVTAFNRAFPDPGDPNTATAGKPVDAKALAEMVAVFEQRKQLDQFIDTVAQALNVTHDEAAKLVGVRQK